MRILNPFDQRKGLLRMSWDPANLFNLWMRAKGPRAGDLDFSRSNRTLFQQRWTAKAMVRAYHGDFIKEKSFKRWYLPKTLPDVRPRRRIRGDDNLELTALAGRGRAAARELKKEAEDEEQALAPVGSLMFTEVERRIDTFVFRCCFAESVWIARRLVLGGHVKLNGVKHTTPNTRLAPGDMITVEPTAISFLRPRGSGADVKLARRARRSAKEAAERNRAEQVAASAAPAAPGSDAPGAYPALRTRIEEKPSAPAPKTPFNLPPYASPWLFVPAYAEVSFPTCSAVYVRHPTARKDYSEVPTPFDADGEIVRLAWEWYSRVRPRTRTKTQLSRMPENRQ